MTTPPIPAGWYADPAGRHERRYWDGTDWTSMVSDGAVTATDNPKSRSRPALRRNASAAGRHGRRRRPAAVIAMAITIACVVGLAAGLVIWAPWQSPPLLRPTGLTAAPSTTSSVAFRWSRPPTGPAPDRYLILHAGKVIASVPGTVTSYRQRGLAPATAYQYRVAAVRDAKRSAASSVVGVSTAIPPLSAARAQGRWTIGITIVRGGKFLSGHGHKRWTESWLVRPKCPAGPCAVRISGDINGHRFKATLARTGATYTGTTTADVFPCGSGALSFPIESTLTIRVTLTSAHADGRAWTATSWTGVMLVASPYTSAGSYYCTASGQNATISGRLGAKSA